MKIRIEYCKRWNYEPRALRARDRLVASGAAEAGDIEIVPGVLGAFEIIVDGGTRYSKLETGRFPDDTEIDGMIWGGLDNFQDWMFTQ